MPTKCFVDLNSLSHFTQLRKHVHSNIDIDFCTDVHCLNIQRLTRSGRLKIKWFHLYCHVVSVATSNLGNLSDLQERLMGAC